jgi:hypothetical protein
LIVLDRFSRARRILDSPALHRLVSKVFHMDNDKQPQSSTSTGGLWIALTFLIGLPILLVIIRKYWGG